MIKAELRKLGILYATEDMKKKAGNSHGYKRDVYGYYNGKYKTVKKDYTYRIYARCQKYGDIFKIALYTADYLIRGKTYPKYETYIDLKAKQYISRSLDGTKENWHTAMIDNFDDIYIAWNEKVYMDRRSVKLLKECLEVEKTDDPFREICKYQKLIRTNKREEKIKRQTDKWDAEMSVVPELPPDWEEWCKDKISQTYMFYKAGTKEATCCMCGETTHIPDIKNNMSFECPNCHRYGTIYATGRIPRYLSTRTSSCFIVQDIPDGYVVRRFGVDMSINKKKFINPHITRHESNRLIFKNGKCTEYCYELFRQRDTRWCENKYQSYMSSYYPSDDSFTYTSNLNKLSKTALKKSAIPIFAREKRGRCNIYSFAKIENMHPYLETIFKADLKKLANDLLTTGSRGEYVDKAQTEVAKILKINKGLLKRLRGKNGTLRYLRFLQLEQMSGKHFDDLLINEFYKRNIDAEDIKFIVNRMGPRAILNYIAKQAEMLNETSLRICRKWEDYLNMAEKAKMQTDMEQIFKPKDLSFAHANVIAILENEKIEEQIKETKKKWKNIEKNLKGLTKYEYSDDKFAIIAPKEIKDIFIEGMALSHCIHTCDFYFDRINRKESYLLFLRKQSNPDASWYTLEVEPSGNIRQESTVGDNLNKDFKQAESFIKKWQKQLKSKLTAEDKKLAKKSEELRVENYANLRKNKNRIWHGVLQGKLLVDVLEDRFMAVE